MPFVTILPPNPVYTLLIYFAVLFCAETPVYSRLQVTVGESVELLCNTSLSSNITWTYDNRDPYDDYVDWNERLYEPRLSTKNPTPTGLLISDAQVNDSGKYNCYDGERLRKVGYQLVVSGTLRRLSLKFTSHCDDSIKLRSTNSLKLI